MIIGISGNSNQDKKLVIKMIRHFADKAQYKVKRFDDKLFQAISLLTGVSNLRDLNVIFDNCWNYHRLIHGKQKTVQMNGGEMYDRLLDIHPKLRENALFADYKNKQKIITNEQDMPNWIVEDVEFQTDIEAIHERKGIVIHMNKENLPEGDLMCFLCDYTLHHDGTNKQLLEKVKMILLHGEIIY